ncbi:MAG: DotH/IcmK family type IV secretion protein [Alphaproteobacteria bacterium]|nr:DotH/IcmK family type IV secretion protein [Alphaproteobacteria bacterium]
MASATPAEAQQNTLSLPELPQAVTIPTIQTPPVPDLLNNNQRAAQQNAPQPPALPIANQQSRPQERDSRDAYDARYNERNQNSNFFDNVLNMGSESREQSPPDQDLRFPTMDVPDVERAVQADVMGRSDEQVKESRRKEAFEAALQGLLPLRPEEIRELMERFDQTQEASTLPVYPNPKPEVAVETLSLDPGAKPAVVKVAYGNVTTLNIVDSTGAPWPIQDVSWAGNFDVMQSGEQGSHIIRITPQSEFAMGNMSIRLLTLQTPVILTLETSRESVHYRFDAIIPEYGPSANVPLIESGTVSIKAGGSEIASFLQGVIPPGATRMSVDGTDGRTTAYTVNDQTYLRTPLTLLSPAWSASVASADGMRVYAIAPTPVVLLSDQGRMIRAKLSEREELVP